ncbi:MAG: MFS transporter [Bacillota bacterium]
MQAISNVLLVGTSAEIYMWVSAVIFGLTAWSIPGIVAACCGDIVGSRNSPAALGVLTFFFGIGTVFGPAIAGYIKEVSLSFNGAFYLAAIVSAVGGVSLWKTIVKGR